MKVFQIVNGVCYWLTPYNSKDDTIGRYPPDCHFEEAPDYVREGWSFKTTDDAGNVLTGDDRFVHPTPPEGYLYDIEEGTFYAIADIPARLKKVQDAKQEENKVRLAKLLASNPITWTDGKQYGISMEDQNEIALNINQYQIQVGAGIENPTLEWHAVHEACTPRTFEEMVALSLAISAAVYPWYRKMQEYKTAIYACTTKEEVEVIDLDYTSAAVIAEVTGVDVEEEPATEGEEETAAEAE